MNDPRLNVITGSDEDAAEALASHLDAFSIRLVLPDQQPTWQHQILALTLVDLLGRSFPRVQVDVHAEATADPALPPGPARLADRIDLAHSHGGLTRQPLTADPYTVHIGPGTGRADLYVDGNGWQSYLGTVPSRLPALPQVPVPVGSIAAACRAAAHITKLALPSKRPVQPPEGVYTSALTYTTDVNPLNEPIPGASQVDAVLVGAGSIGGAAVYAFKFTPHLTGRLTPVDPQRLERRNSRRALLATTAVATAEERKVDVVAAALDHHGPRLVVTPYAGSITEYHATLPREMPLPLVLCAVDTHDARRSIQDCLPLELINAACRPDEITISGHRTDDGPCVCCLHMPDVLNRDQVKMRLIAKETGLDEGMISALLVEARPLDTALLRRIERYRNLAAGALDRYAGQTIHDLWNGFLLYGETLIACNTSTAAVPAPFVTALAGALLAGEALKAGTPALAQYRLGPHGIAIRYKENPYASPQYRQLDDPPRWLTSECLCRSSRRLRILRQRHGLIDAENDH
jgi:ThiF family